MKDVMKLAKKEFPKFGARLRLEGARSQLWEMPWGEKWNVWRGQRLNSVRDKLDELRARADPLTGSVPAEAPRMVNVRTSKHFAERLELMQSQETVTPEDVRLACLEPAETRRFPAAGSYAYVRGDIAVVAAPYRDGMRLITVLWTRPEMWARNPRPEMEAARV